MSEKENEKHEINTEIIKENPQSDTKKEEKPKETEKITNSYEQNSNSSIKHLPNPPQNKHSSQHSIQTQNEDPTQNQQHKKVEKIVGMKIENDKKSFLVKYAGQKELEVVDGAIIRKHNQKVLLNFYEENIKLVELDQETAMQILATKPK